MKNIVILLITVFFTNACSNNNNKNLTDKVLENVLISNDTCKRIDDYLIKISSEKNFSGGLLIVEDGKRIFCKGYGWADKENKIPFLPSTLASIGSITKSFTAAAIMKLVEMKKLSVDDPLIKFFPTAPSDKANITIHQLLTHSSGFHEFLIQDGGDYKKIEKMEFVVEAFKEPLAFKPGEKAIYTNVGYSILGIIIEQVAGIDYEKFLKLYLFEPIGIKNIGYHFPLDVNDTIAIGYQNGKIWGTHQQHFKQAGGGPFWNLKANGGLEASLDEMFLWVNSFTNQSIFNEASIQKMFTAHIKEEGYNGTSSFGYGSNISESIRKTKVIGNGGSNGIYFARLVRLPVEGLVFYMVTNESTMNANMILPNISQLYFKGKIDIDALSQKPKFENELSKRIFDIIEKPTTTDLAIELAKEGIKVENDMVLLEVGQSLIQESKNDRALILYKYYTKVFPDIVVAWNDLADVYLNLNNKVEAIKCYKHALKIRPGNPRAKESLDKLI